MNVKLISIWNWFQITAVITLWTILVSLIFVLSVPFDRVRRLVGFIFRKGGHLMVWLNPLWSVEVTGFKPRGRMAPHVVISNHQSMADIPVISHVPWEMKWLSKRANFKLPGMGWMMRMVGDIPLDRGDKESASRAMAGCRWYLDHGMSVMIFPEGTRTQDGKLLPFKDGAFRLAIESGKPILPVVVAGTSDCLPKHSWLFKTRSRMRVHVLDPVPVTGLTLDDLERVKLQIRAQMAATLEQLNRSEGAPATVPKGTQSLAG